MIKKSIVGLFVLMVIMFLATESSFAQSRPTPGQMGGLLGVGSGVARPQATNLYYQNGGAYYGRVTVYPGSHFWIDLGNGGEIKTFRNSCSQVNSGGVPGVLCSFAQFKQGKHIYSGWGYFFQNGIVYLAWTNENMGAYWRQINTGWYGFRP